jgi:hypothetical protein
MSDKMKEWMKSKQALKLLDQGVNVAEQENVVEEHSVSRCPLVALLADRPQFRGNPPTKVLTARLTVAEAPVDRLGIPSYWPLFN